MVDRRELFYQNRTMELSQLFRTDLIFNDANHSMKIGKIAKELAKTTFSSEIDFFELEFVTRLFLHVTEPKLSVIVTTHMSAAIFFFSCYQYVIMAFVFSVGEPFRQPGNIYLHF